MREVSDIIWLDEADSTNSEARRRLPCLDNLSVIAAKCQKCGRGQGDHTWTSAPGMNLTFSVILKPGDLAASDALLVTQCVTHALTTYLESKDLKPRIKWPNDIYVGDLKICGILIENVISGKKIVSTIAGIGLNVNQRSFPPEIPNPVSISMLTGDEYDPEAELQSFMSYMKESVLLLESQTGRTILNNYFFAKAFNIPEGMRL